MRRIVVIGLMGCLFQGLSGSALIRENELTKEKSRALGRALLKGHPVVRFIVQQIPLKSCSRNLRGEDCFSRERIFGSRLLTLHWGYRYDFNLEIKNLVTQNVEATFDRDSSLHGKALINEREDRFLSELGEGSVGVFDIMSRKCLQTLTCKETEIDAITFSTEGDTVVTISSEGKYSRPRMVRIWDSVQGTCQSEFKLQGSFSGRLAFNAAADVLLIGKDSSMTEVYDRAGSLLCTLKGSFLGLNPDGTKAVTSLRGMKIWDTKMGNCLGTLPSSATYARFSDDSTMLLSYSSDQESNIWDLKTKACLFTCKGQIHFSNESLVQDDALLKADTDRIVFQDARILGQTISVPEFFFMDILQKFGKVLLSQYENSVKIADLSPLNGVHDFIQKRVTHKQALLLKALYEVILYRNILEDNRMLFQMSKDSQVRKDYDDLPGEIKQIFEPYVEN